MFFICLAQKLEEPARAPVSVDIPCNDKKPKVDQLAPGTAVFQGGCVLISISANKRHGPRPKGKHTTLPTSESPKGVIGVINVALYDPSDLTVDSKSGYLLSQKRNSWVVGTLPGQTTYYSNSSTAICQICFIPFIHGWYRFTAMLGQVYGEPILLFLSWKGGFTFGTNRYDSNGFSAPGKSGKGGSVAPIEGSILKKGKESQYNLVQRHRILRTDRSC